MFFLVACLVFITLLFAKNGFCESPYPHGHFELRPAIRCAVHRVPHRAESDGKAYYCEGLQSPPQQTLLRADADDRFP